MSIRLRLAAALVLTALIPMGVAAGVAMLRAGSAARREAEIRLATTRHQAEVLLARQSRALRADLDRAAWDLVNDLTSIDMLLRAAGSRDSESAMAPAPSPPAAAARDVASSVESRYGFDHLEVLGPGGVVLSTSLLDQSLGRTSAFADLPEGTDAVRRLPPRPYARRGSVALFARRTLPLGNDSLSLVGARTVDTDLIPGISEISGQGAALIDPEGATVTETGPAPDAAADPAGVISADLPLGDDGWKIRVSVPAGDVAGVRANLFGTFAVIAPFAIASALLAGALIAQRISRPIRALAARADTISRERSGPLTVPEEPDELRGLQNAFDRMIEALSHSERQRIGAERIAAWQEVARRIAHEVRNPLSPIRLAVENLRRTRTRAPEKFDESFDVETATILEEVDSLRRLVDEFTNFARLSRPDPVPTDPRQIVSHALVLLAPRIEANGVRANVDDAGAPASVMVDPEQMGRVVKNIVSNALDALEGVTDRRLDITLRTVPGRGGQDAEIEIRDTGVGLDAEAQQRLFEPYFTTRAEQGGTGLGMAIAYRIVTEHRGSIRVEGAPGRGAKVIIRVPVAGPGPTGSALREDADGAAQESRELVPPDAPVSKTPCRETLEGRDTDRDAGRNGDEES